MFTLRVKGDACAEIRDKAEEIVEHEHIKQRLRTRFSMSLDNNNQYLIYHNNDTADKTGRGVTREYNYEP
jgi:hypothetical protein